MVGEISSYTVSAELNVEAPPNGFPEGWAPSAVNDSLREMAARLKKFYNDSIKKGDSINTFSGQVVMSALTVQGPASFSSLVIQGPLGVSGHSTLSSLSVLGPTTLSSLAVQGPLRVDGHATISSLSVLAAVTVSSLAVLAALTVAGPAFSSASVTASHQLTTKQYVDATGGFAVNQAWSDVTASRDIIGTVFQNLTGLPITALLNVVGSAGTIRFSMGSTNPPTDVVVDSSSSGAGVATLDTIMIPVDWYYKCVVISGSRTLTKWYELR